TSACLTDRRRALTLSLAGKLTVLNSSLIWRIRNGMMSGEGARQKLDTLLIDPQSVDMEDLSYHVRLKGKNSMLHGIQNQTFGIKFFPCLLTLSIAVEEPES